MKIINLYIIHIKEHIQGSPRFQAVFVFPSPKTNENAMDIYYHLSGKDFAFSYALNKIEVMK